jgi:hypothetical protein
MITIARAEEHHIKEIAQLWLEFILFHQGIEPSFEPREDAVAGEAPTHRYCYSQN